MALKRWLIFFLIGTGAEAELVVKPQELPAISVESPARITSCSDSQWVYSIGLKTLVKISPKSDSEARQIAINVAQKRWFFHSLGCFKDQLLVGLGFPNKEDELYGIDLNDPMARLAHLNLPGKAPIRDISCLPKFCYVLRDKIYFTKNLESWKTIAVPPTTFLRPKDQELRTNPFSYWSDTFNFAKSTYGRIVPLNSDDFLLLDSPRSTIATVTPTSSKTWGKWGVWNDRMMFPKGITLVGQDFLAITDPPTDRVMFFRVQGDFIGDIVGDNGHVLFSYPIDLDYKGDVLSVVDFEANKVRRFRLSLPLKSIQQDTDEVARANHLRLPEVIKNMSMSRCLNCHDGFLQQSLEQFQSNRSNHYQFTQCQACHDGHHSLQRFSGQPLVKPESELCLSCHQKIAGHAQMHISKGCYQCHQMHGAFEKQLKDPQDLFCTSCHKSRSAIWHPVIIVAGTDRARGITLHDRKIFCGTCHQVHGTSPKADQFTNFCSTCHGDKAPQLFKDFHKHKKRINP